MEARQKLILEAEEGKQKNGKAIDPDEAGTYCRGLEGFDLDTTNQ